jgi:hypothetical protein
VASRLELRGLDELRAALRNLPGDLAEEAAVIVEAQAAEAERSIEAGYPEGPTGNLRRGVVRESNRSKFGVAAIVRSRAPHAHLFEAGTKPRRTAKGANRGAMPPAAEAQRFVPKAIRARARMFSALKDLVRRAGLVVED